MWMRGTAIDSRGFCNQTFHTIAHSSAAFPARRESVYETGEVPRVNPRSLVTTGDGACVSQSGNSLSSNFARCNFYEQRISDFLSGPTLPRILRLVGSGGPSLESPPLSLYDPRLKIGESPCCLLQNPGRGSLGCSRQAPPVLTVFRGFTILKDVKEPVGMRRVVRLCRSLRSSF